MVSPASTKSAILQPAMTTTNQLAYLLTGRFNRLLSKEASWVCFHDTLSLLKYGTHSQTLRWVISGTCEIGGGCVLNCVNVVQTHLKCVLSDCHPHSIRGCGRLGGLPRIEMTPSDKTV